jgi:putative phosphoribosyl transferase
VVRQAHHEWARGKIMFKDRFDAGHKLAEKLQKYKDDSNAVILAIPRGALEIGSVLSRELHIPLDVILTKKIGYPGNPEYAIGAMSLETIIIDRRAIEFSGELESYLKKEVEEIRQLLHERSKAYHGNKEPISLENKIVIVTDDGIATGRTLEVTLDLIKKQHPAKIIVAVPVASKEAINLIKKKVDEVICLEVPDFFMSVSQWYDHFDQVNDEQAIALLQGSYL